MQATQPPETDWLDMKSLLSGLIEDNDQKEVARQKEYKRKLNLKFKKQYVLHQNDMK